MTGVDKLHFNASSTFSQKTTYENRRSITSRILFLQKCDSVCFAVFIDSCPWFQLLAFLQPNVPTKGHKNPQNS